MRLSTGTSPLADHPNLNNNSSDIGLAEIKWKQNNVIYVYLYFSLPNLGKHGKRKYKNQLFKYSTKFPDFFGGYISPLTPPHQINDEINLIYLEYNCLIIKPTIHISSNQ